MYIIIIIIIIIIWIYMIIKNYLKNSKLHEIRWSMLANMDQIPEKNMGIVKLRHGKFPFTL
jgi:hypothetical protein